ncbi:MAG: hypothetical protein LUQ01_01860, partial [Methanolinea sp.]|nr:hypothetical protein [Methanolinea sp.]
TWIPSLDPSAARTPPQPNGSKVTGDGSSHRPPLPSRHRRPDAMKEYVPFRRRKRARVSPRLHHNPWQGMMLDQDILKVPGRPETEHARNAVRTSVRRSRR